METVIRNYLQTLSGVLARIDVKEIEEVAKVFLQARDSNGTIYVFGNGGSGSTASHMVCDLLKGCSYNREKKFRIICLNDNIPTILAYANDVSYEDLFVEQLRNFLQAGDVVLGISGSGNSPNVIKAVNYANQKNNTTIGFTGYNGGELRKIASYSVNAGIDDMQISEDIHLITLHILYKILAHA